MSKSTLSSFIVPDVCPARIYCLLHDIVMASKNSNNSTTSDASSTSSSTSVRAGADETSTPPATTDDGDEKNLDKMENASGMPPPDAEALLERVRAGLNGSLADEDTSAVDCRRVIDALSEEDRKRFWETAERLALASSHDGTMDRILPRLYVGSMHAAYNEVLLFRNRISHICSCLEAEPCYPDIIKYLVFNAKDHTTYDIVQHFDEALGFIEEGMAATGVFVHCHGGVSRSAAVAMAYIMRRYRLNTDVALRIVREGRGSCYPNEGFMTQLSEWEGTLQLVG
eukprot:PhM_4_TR9239/c0_g1_i1/m.72584